MTLRRDEEPCRVTPRLRCSPRPLLFALAQALLPFSLILPLPLSGQIPAVPVLAHQLGECLGLGWGLLVQGWCTCTQTNGRF